MCVYLYIYIYIYIYGANVYTIWVHRPLATVSSLDEQQGEAAAGVEQEEEEAAAVEVPRGDAPHRWAGRNRPQLHTSGSLNPKPQNPYLKGHNLLCCRGLLSSNLGAPNSPKQVLFVDSGSPK